MRTFRVFPLAILALGLVLGACRPGGAYYVDELDLVGTAYTKDIDFTSRKTYAMWDTIVQISSDDISDPDGDGKPDYLPQGSANTINKQIDDNMAKLGWTKVDKSQNPDVFIQNATMQTTYVYYYYSYWYYGWYYPYGGWYYPGYYPPTYSTTQTGSLLMLMVDNSSKHNNANPSGKAPALWMGVVNGLTEGSSSNFTSRVVKSVDQAFKQSPILKR